MLRGLVFGEKFRHQMAPVRGGADQHVIRQAGDGAVERGFQRLVSGVARLERKIVGEQNELARLVFQPRGDIGQVDQIFAIHFHQAQPLLAVARQQGLDQRRLAATATAGEQHVIRRQSLEKLADVAVEAVLLHINAGQRRPRWAVQRRHRRQHADAKAGLPAPAASQRLPPIDARRRRRQPGIQPRQQIVAARDQQGEFRVDQVTG